MLGRNVNMDVLVGVRCEMRCETTGMGGGGLIHGIKNVSAFSLLLTIAVVSKVPEYGLYIEACPRVGLGSAHLIPYGRLLWHHTV